MIGSKLTAELKMQLHVYLVECPIVLINYLCFWEECSQKFEMNKTFQVYSFFFFELIDSCTNS